MQDNSVLIGASPEGQQFLDLKLANRHGLVTGATGTGKTVTLQILAEGFAAQGVPVFCADAKGDLAGIAETGEPKDFITKRAQEVGLGEMEYGPSPVIFWDLFGQQGHPIRTTVTEMGPLLLSRMLDLSEAQEGALNIAFKIADDEGLLLVDLKDLKALLMELVERPEEIRSEYGSVSKASIGAIQRKMLVFENQGGEDFFGEPALDIRDLMRIDRDGRGFINVLAADKLMQSPRLYAMFLLFLMSELFEELPEVGDPEKPKLVFFFDEAHLLFDEAPPILMDKIEQVVRLIRSKGVGVYFVTQNPLDIPESVLAQLGNRVQHALRAYTPREQKAVKTAASTFRQNPEFDTADAITQLGVGEALVSTLGGKGVPTIVQRTLIRPPASRIGPVDFKEREAIMSDSPVRGMYDTPVDRESAYEVLAERAKKRAEEERLAAEREEREKELARLEKEASKRTKSRSSRSSRSDSLAEAVLKSAGRSVASSVGRQIGKALLRGILGSLAR
ncbi:helicase HerA-like domain-containing protein [Tepidamorphus sp. 3E244]|uniref:helicase HerA-like domain-containing protein n=1 Tax=Tepidamorphus sp. 3E244 TaxID=3385498 RepID=UPI0038FD3517